MIAECSYILPTGKKCRAIALRGKCYCFHHIGPARKRRGLAPASPQSLNLPALDSRGAIHQAATQVVDALATEKLDLRRARLLLQGLQLASKNLAPPTRRPADELTS